MSDLPEGIDPEQALGPPLSQSPQALEDFRTSVPEEMQPWADHATTLLHDFIVRDSIARTNASMGEAYANTLDGVKSTLSGVVRGNPLAADLALGLWRSISAQAVIGHPNLPEEAHGPIQQALYAEGAKEIATNGVMSAAQRDAGLAKDMLTNYAEHFTPGEISSLDGNISVLDLARTADAAGEAAKATKARKEASESKFLTYSNEFNDRNTGKDTIPGNGYLQRIVNDTRPGGLTATQAATLKAHYEKVTGVGAREALVGQGGFPAGGVEKTNYQVATDTARRLANGTLSLEDVLGRVGPGLEVHHANLLAEAVKVDPAGLPAYVNIIDRERARLAGKDGEVTDGQAIAQLDEVARRVLDDWRRGGPGTLQGHPAALVMARSKAEAMADPVLRDQLIREMRAGKELTEIVGRPAKERAEALHLAEFNARQELSRTRLVEEEQRRAQTEAERQQREAQQAAIHADATRRVEARALEQDRRERNREIEAQQREARAAGRSAEKSNPLDAFRRGLRSTVKGA